MSDKEIDQAVADAADEEATSVEGPTPEQTATEQQQPVKSAVSPGSPLAWLAFLVALIALALAGYTAWRSWQNSSDTSTDDRIARLESRVSASATSVDELEARVKTLGQRDPGIDAALDALRREFDERVRLLDSLPTRMSTLESSVASLAGISEGARDAWVLAESEYYMQIANAQLQLANNPRLATLALRMADERIVQLADPGLTDVRRAIADELAALDVMEKPDIEGATLTLASLSRVVESLPLAGAGDVAEEEGAVDPELSGMGRAWASVKNTMSKLVTVTPVEQARLTQLSPDAGHFLRSNIALQLQGARLALLRGEQAIFQQTLDDTTALLNEYFETGSPQVAGALQTIAEIRAHVFVAEFPDISESLRLLRQYRTLRENAQ